MRRTLTPTEWSEVNMDDGSWIPKKALAEDYPGMVQICLFHAHNDGWREPGSRDCVCERVTDPKELAEAQVKICEIDLGRLTQEENELIKELENVQHKLKLYHRLPARLLAYLPATKHSILLKYPGMYQVCLSHSRTDGWEGGGREDCCCETLIQAENRLTGEISTNRELQKDFRLKKTLLETAAKAL
jgi:hypothetical protein